MTVTNIQGKKSISDADALVIFRVGPVYCCAPTMAVISIVMPPEFTALPGKTSSEPGIFKSANRIVHVVDLRNRFGVDAVDRSPVGRIIIAEVENGRDGFWVDEIIDIVQFPMRGWGGVPLYIPKDVFQKTLMLNDVINLYTDFDCLHNLKTNGLLRAHIENIKRGESGAKAQDKRDSKAPEIKSVAVKKEHDDIFESELAISDNSGQGSPADVAIPGYNEPGPGRENSVKADDRAVKPAGHRATVRVSGYGRGGEPQVARLQYSKFPDMEVATSNKVAAPDVVFSPVKNIGQRDGIRNDNVGRYDSVYLFVAAILVICIITIILMFNLPGLDTGKVSDGGRQVLIGSAKLHDAEDKHDSPINRGLDKNVDFRISSRESQVPERVAEESRVEFKKDVEGIIIIVTDDSVAEAEAQVAIEPISKNVVDDETNFVVKSADEKMTKEKTTLVPPVIESVLIKDAELTDGYNTKVIIHVVKKGDTLWHIALRYINNPYRYPELARLSKINNPDRIYPGNRVKIIIKTRKK